MNINTPGKRELNDWRVSLQSRLDKIMTEIDGESHSRFSGEAALSEKNRVLCEIARVTYSDLEKLEPAIAELNQ